MRPAARAASTTRPYPRRFALPGRGRTGMILDYCAREMAPPVGSASRNRETMYSRQMGRLAQYVKQINFLPAATARPVPRNGPDRVDPKIYQLRLYKRRLVPDASFAMVHPFCEVQQISRLGYFWSDMIWQRNFAIYRD